MRNVRLRTYNPYTKIPKTNNDMKYGHVHYNTIVAIAEIIRDHGGSVNWSEVSEKTGVSRSTLGKHFGCDPLNALCTAIEEMLHNVDDWLEKRGHFCSRKGKEYNKFILEALFGIMDQGSEFFSVACAEYQYEGIIHRVATKLVQHLNFDWYPHGLPAPDIDSERVGMCIRMMEEVILRWGRETGCDKNQADRYTARILRIVSLAEENKLP